jgi:hypothetical protein
MLEFEPDDFPKAEGIARALGFEQTAYTSTSALWGLFCLPENPRYARRGQATEGGCIIKTAELGFLFVQDGEDRHLGNDWADVEPVSEEEDEEELLGIPADFPVQPIDPDDPSAIDPATCGTCGRTWDDGKVTSWTPAPSGRCPFEYFHGEEI